MTPFETAARKAIATRLAPATREDYVRALNRWLEFCTERGFDSAAPSEDAAAAFRDAVAKGEEGEKLESSTVRNYLAALSFVYGALLAKEKPAATWNPFSSKAMPWPPAPKEGLTEAMTKEEAERILDACAKNDKEPVVPIEVAKRDMTVLQLLYETGLRRMSILSLRRDRIFRRETSVVARVQVKGSGGGAFNEVALPANVMKALDAWLEVAPQGQYVFPSRNKKGHMDLSMVNKILLAWAGKANVVAAHPHRFRAAFITAAFDAGLNPRDIQAAVHHSDPRSTQRYDRGLRGAGVAEAVAKARALKK